MDLLSAQILSENKIAKLDIPDAMGFILWAHGLEPILIPTGQLSRVKTATITDSAQLAKIRASEDWVPFFRIQMARPAIETLAMCADDDQEA